MSIDYLFNFSFTLILIYYLFHFQFYKTVALRDCSVIFLAKMPLRNHAKLRFYKIENGINNKLKLG